MNCDRLSIHMQVTLNFAQLWTMLQHILTTFSGWKALQPRLMSSTSCQECGRHLQNGVLCGLAVSVHLKSSRWELFPDDSIYFTVYLKNNIYYMFPGLNWDFGWMFCVHLCMLMMEMQWSRKGLGGREGGGNVCRVVFGVWFGRLGISALLN